MFSLFVNLSTDQQETVNEPEFSFATKGLLLDQLFIHFIQSLFTALSLHVEPLENELFNANNLCIET